MSIYVIGTIVVFIISATCGLVFIPAILNFCKAKNLYDIPNARKVHKNAVPRLGGISFMPSMFLSFAVALLYINSSEELITINLWSLYFLISILLIYGMGITDDILGLSPLVKFVVQIVAACMLPFSGLYLNNMYGFMGVHEIPFFIGAPLTVLAIVFIDNAINLIDGIDGLAASLSIIALVGFLVIFITQDVWTYAILIAGLIGVLVAFLYFNLFGDPDKNRKIFMGDSGSLTLGFILGFLCVKYSMQNPNVIIKHDIDFIMAFTLLIVPMFDVVRVFMVRIYHKKSPFLADKRHIHHKFMAAGLSQHQTLLTIIAIALAYIALNYNLLQHMSNTCVFIVDVALYIILNLILNALISRKAAQTNGLA